MQQKQSFQGKGKTIAELNRVHDRMVKAGKPPAVKSMPIRAASLKHKPAWQQKQEEEDKKG